MRRKRILVAKPGLDGHDKAAKVVALALRDAGFDVIYTGLHKTVEEIARIAKQEDVDAIGLSIYSGAHIPVTEKLMELLKKEGMEDKIVLVGGVIPKRDVPKLKELGVKEVFPGGMRLSDVVSRVKEILEGAKNE